MDSNPGVHDIYGYRNKAGKLRRRPVHTLVTLFMTPQTPFIEMTSFFRIPTKFHRCENEMTQITTSFPSVTRLLEIEDQFF